MRAEGSSSASFAFLESVLAVLLPADCYLCGERLGRRHILGACPACWGTLERVGEPSCGRCAVRLPARTDLLGPARGQCLDCAARPTAIDDARAAVVYDRTAQAVLLRAKFGQRREIFRPIGLAVAAIARASGLADGADFVVGVPSHPMVGLRRGFAPGPEIAAIVGRSLGLPARSALLARRWSSPRATKRLGLTARRRAAEDAIRSRGAVPKGCALLVDDVLTSGATARACAVALRRGGATEVRLVVWARTPPPLGSL